MKLKCILIVACSLFTLTGQADEGMWMLGNLNKQTRKTMKELGLQMPADRLYNPKKPSLKDAVVSFGGFCSGVVVSEDGLVFTNHHCGFSSVQQHSSVEHDYLKDGFVARSRAEELPNPELYVRFLLRTEDVTKRVLGAVKPSMNEMERSSAVDSMMMVIGGEVSLKDSTLLGVVDAYYGGNEFWLSVYRDFNDVRLVFAPPSSVGIEEMMNNSNQAQIDIRGVKQAIWKREMDSKDSIRIKYASKYDESSNYWKNSIGVNRAIRKLGILEKKREMEQEIRRWIQQNPDEREKLLQLFTDLELNYKNRREVNRAQAYFIESFLYGPELVQLALKILNFDFEGEQKTVIAALKDIVEQYSNLDLDIDKEVFTALLKEYRSKVDTTFLPEIYHTIAQKYNGDEKAFVDSLYASSELTTPRGLKRFLERDTTYQIFDDPAISLGIDMLTMLFDMNMQMQAPTTEIIRGERLLNGAIRRMYTSRNFYPDANSTMRLSFGTVCGYTPFDGAEYDYYTTTKGVLEKVKAHVGDVDFAVQPEILSLLSSGNFGRYADEKGEMKVCFISNNDITGGNSGSAMFNSKGELLGLAFDGNWEAMGSDILYEPKMQRTIGVDVRYILFMIEKYGKAGNLIQELNILN